MSALCSCLRLVKVAHPLISVIIPTFNKAPVLVKTLEALQRQTLPHGQFEVVVVDDGSTDSTEALVNGLSLPDRYHYLHQDNFGAGRARNCGAELAQGDLFLFLDSDIVLYPDALAAHLAAHTGFDRLLMVSRILPMDPNPNGMEDLFFQETMDFGPDEKLMTWKHTITQCLSVKKQHFVEIGGFDVNLRRCQDIDFGYRAEQAGFDIRYLPQAEAWHNHSLTLEARCRVERTNHKGFAAFFQKHPHLSDQMPHLKDKAPIDWHTDSPILIARKCSRAILATKPARVTMLLAWKALYRTALPVGFLRSLYWKIVSSYQFLGYREGLRSRSDGRGT